MASAASSLLATILRDVDANPANVQGALAVLRGRTLIAVVDTQTLDAWSSRLQALLRGPVPEARVAAAALLSETVQQCTQFEFARHREQWAAALLHLLQLFERRHLARGVGQGGRRTISERSFTRSD